MSAAPVLSLLKSLKLEALKGPHQGEVFQFKKDVVTAGRGEENDLCLKQDPKVSRFHFEIRQTNGKISIHNISQKNFVFVNGLKIQSSNLDNNSRILLGDTEFIFKTDSAAKELQPSVQLVENVFDSQTVRVPLQVAEEPKVKTSREIPKTNPNPSQQGYYAPSSSIGGGSSRVRFYLIIAAVLGVVGYLVFSPDDKKEKTTLRQSDEVFKEMTQAELNIQNQQKEVQKTGADTPQFQMAQQNYLKGFRDYRQGQYSRAILSFQAALSFYPQHDLSKKYLVLSRKRFDELVKFNMNQGRIYKSKDNFRLCADSFSKVIVMLKDANDPTYKEAKLYFDECSLKLQGRF